LAYDNDLKRLHVLHGGTANLLATQSPTPSPLAGHFTTDFILDFRIGAWYKHEFACSATKAILYPFITDVDGAPKKRLRFMVQQSTTTVEVCDMDQTSFDEFSGVESPLPVMFTGWDQTGEFQKRGKAPIITVFSKRTETGYTSTGGGWEGDNESSTSMTAYWDWTDDAVSNKIGAATQVYKHVRAFVPSAADDVNGYPVVVTRNKVRGRGRALQLKFEGAADKDSHLLGFNINHRKVGYK
jgi:hypothetical protein